MLRVEHVDLLSLTAAEFIARASQFGEKRPAALAHYREFFRRGTATPDWITLKSATISECVKEGGTTKFTQRIEDGLETETVILPYTSRSGRRRNTLCVSSQIGCAMGCTFCETARMGLMKNLSVARIVGQWFAARFELETAIDNIVFMGMGEPMDNLDSVLGAIRIFTDANGPAIAPSRITVSTVGRIDGIRRFTRFADTDGLGSLRLAVSINAPNDAIRSDIMPLNRAEPMGELMKAMLEWTKNRHRRVLIEYVLIPGVNDEPRHARELCKYLKPLPCTVNVIAYNPRRDSPWPATTEEGMRSFTEHFAACGQFVTRRQIMGRSVMAACGQLGNERIRNRRLVSGGFVSGGFVSGGMADIGNAP